MKDKWLANLTFLQIAIVAWITMSQFLFSAVSNSSPNSSNLVWSSALLVSICVPAFLLTRSTKVPFVYAMLLLETLLAGFSARAGIVSGYQLLILITVAKSGLLLQKLQWLLASAVIVVTYFCLSANNSQLVIQSSSGFSSSSGMWGTLIGRELPSLLSGAALVVGLVWAIRAERGHRIELERLSGKLAEISAELERDRVLTEIRGSLESLLEKIQSNLGEISSDVKYQTADKISQTRELAGEALTSIRRALKLLRRLEPEQEKFDQRIDC